MSRRISLGPKTATVTLDGSGNGIARAQPKTSERWQITGAAVSVATNTAEAAAVVYSGPAGPFAIGLSTLLGATSTGSSGDSFGPVVEINPGQQLQGQWTGGDPGALATLTYWGTRDVP